MELAIFSYSEGEDQTFSGCLACLQFMFETFVSVVCDIFISFFLTRLTLCIVSRLEPSIEALFVMSTTVD